LTDRQLVFVDAAISNCLDGLAEVGEGEHATAKCQRSGGALSNAIVLTGDARRPVVHYHHQGEPTVDSKPNLSMLAQQLKALESETFEIQDYTEVNDMLVISDSTSTSSTSTSSSTTSTTSCCA